MAERAARVIDLEEFRQRRARNAAQAGTNGSPTAVPGMPYAYAWPYPSAVAGGWMPMVPVVFWVPVFRAV